MFRSNSTCEWLQNKPDSERKRCINSAIADGVVERKRDVHKKKKHNEKVKLRVREKQQALTEKAEKAQKKKHANKTDQ